MDTQKQYYHHGLGDIYNHALLNTLDDFMEHLYSKSMFSAEEGEILYKEIEVLRREHPMFYLYLKDMISAKVLIHTCFFGRKYTQSDKLEKDYQDILINDFSVHFPEYTFISKEHVLPFGRIDILAKNAEGRDVIIEMKIGKNNATLQLLSYSTCFDNPILISISHIKPQEKSDRIIYKTYDEMGMIT